MEMVLIDSDDDDENRVRNLLINAPPFGADFLLVTVVAIVFVATIFLTRDNDATTFCIVAVVTTAAVVVVAADGDKKIKIRCSALSVSKTQCASQFDSLVLSLSLSLSLTCLFG